MNSSDFSPADSLLSHDGDTFISLFGDDESMSPGEGLTPPRSVAGDTDRDSSRTSTQEPEKKPQKKRKSWGQELPTPTTNLPPRKRAKTEAEKEQRRIERVLRNRAAAQSSRERKRKEVEALEEEKAEIEKENSRLSSRLREVEQQNLLLSQQIAEMAAKMTVFQQHISGSLPTPESRTLSIASPALSQVDSTSRKSSVKLEYEPDLDFSLPPPHSTLDPNALLSSPSNASIDDPTATSLNLTQHPAEMLCDQQCQLRLTRPQWGQTMEAHEEQRRQQLAFSTLVATLTQLLFLTMSSTVFSLLHLPLHRIFSSLKTGKPLFTNSTTTEAYSLFPLILWLTSTPLNPLSETTTGPSSTNVRESRLPTFRIHLLERFLACSPALARPLRDATAEALQLVSDSMVEFRNGRAESDPSSSGFGGLTQLMTMLWVIESIEESQRNGRPADSWLSARRNEDPASDVRRLCVALDVIFKDETSGGEQEKVSLVGGHVGHTDVAVGDDGPESLHGRLASLVFDGSALAGKRWGRI